MFVIPMLLRPGRESQQRRNYKKRSFAFGCLNTKWPFVLLLLLLLFFNQIIANNDK